MAKLYRTSFPLSTTRSMSIFELFHIDIWGPYPQKTYNGSQYFLTIVDDYFRASWVHLMAHKSNAFPLLKAFSICVKKQFAAAMKVVRTDNGLEFKEASALKSYKSKGIAHQTSCEIHPNKMG